MEKICTRCEPKYYAIKGKLVGISITLELSNKNNYLVVERSEFTLLIVVDFVVEIYGTSCSWVIFYENWQGFRPAEGFTSNEEWNIAVPFLSAMSLVRGGMLILAVGKTQFS